MNIVLDNAFIIVKGIVVAICIGLSVWFLTTNSASKNIKSFNDGDVLVCHSTLIVTNSNWSLSGEHLINNNSAGYLDIRNCVRKD